MKSAPPATALGRCRVAWAAAAASLYVWACVIYLVYCCQALAVDFCDVTHPAHMVNTSLTTPTGDPNDPYYYSYYEYEEPAPVCDEAGDTPINRQYVALAAVHLVSAFVYAGAWRPWYAAHGASAPLWARVLIMVPEALNVVEAALYIYTSTLYAPLSDKANACYSDPDCDGYHRLHRLELAAAVVSMAASLLWAWSWWYTHERGAGRGLTPFDPDLWSSLLLVVPSASEGSAPRAAGRAAGRARAPRSAAPNRRAPRGCARATTPTTMTTMASSCYTQSAPRGPLFASVSSP